MKEEPEIELAPLIAKVRLLNSSQREVFELIAKNPDKNNSELCAQLGISKSAFDQRLSAAYRILGLPRNLGIIFRRQLFARMWAHSEVAPEPVPKPNGHDQAPPSVPPQPEALASAGFSGEGAAISIPLSEPHSIVGVRFLRADTPDAESIFGRFLADGYLAEYVSEFQSLAHPERSSASIVFVKRR